MLGIEFHFDKKMCPSMERHPRILCWWIVERDLLLPYTQLGNVVEIFNPLSVSLGASLVSRLSPCS